jgi:DNA modification methylase
MIEFGDCRETMRRWKEQGVKAKTCVTSPPYYGLRSYLPDGVKLKSNAPEWVSTELNKLNIKPIDHT